jgi:hypothetical protein
MRKPGVIGLATAVVTVLVLAVGAAASSERTPKRYRANLTVRAEVPSPKDVPRLAGGTFSAKLDGTTLKWDLRFRRLSGKATAAHIHTGAKGKAGPVIVPLCGPCKSRMSGTARLTASEVSALASGKTYVNVHTARNPAGELRGQL